MTVTVERKTRWSAYASGLFALLLLAAIQQLQGVDLTPLPDLVEPAVGAALAWAVSIGTGYAVKHSPVSLSPSAVAAFRSRIGQRAK